MDKVFFGLEIEIDAGHYLAEFLANVSVHQIRPTQRTFTTSTTFPSPVNALPTSAVGFGWHVLFCLFLPDLDNNRDAVDIV